ncbi:MAG: hypothetical protein H5T95_07510 [Firmicutes bacterium]|nr:hypothetical protein [Bacillota bacterium]
MPPSTGNTTLLQRQITPVPTIRGGIERLTGIMQLIRDQGLAPGSRIIDFRYDKSDTEISDKLLLKPGSEVVILEIVKVAAGCPRISANASGAASIW